LVEDFADAREVLAGILKRDGYAVAEACHGREAVDKALQLKPDVMVMDLSLPVLDGAAAARVLKTYRSTSRIPIAALTGSSRVSDAERALFDIVLTKPCSPEVLLESIRTLAANRPDRRDRQDRLPRRG
jgi:CheY-like chemotaxis protein